MRNMTGATGSAQPYSCFGSHAGTGTAASCPWHPESARRSFACLPASDTQAMPFDSGSVSCQRYAVVGDAPKAPTEDLLDKLAEFRLAGAEDSVGLPDEVEVGFCGGRHVLDNRFDFGHCVFDEAVSLGLRVDTNKVPGELKKAYVAMEEDAAAAGNSSGFVSKAQKREAKDTAGRRFDQELRDGLHRRSKMAPILWDLPRQTLFGPASAATRAKMGELFEKALGVRLFPLTSGTLALRRLEGSGRRRDYEDARPTRFAVGPEGESQPAEYPWVAKGPEAKDFLGNEFLVWLWHAAQHRRTTVNDTAIFFDRSLDLDCAFGMTGRDSLRGDGPAAMPEALDGLRSGKVVRKAGLVLDKDGQTYSFTLAAESLAVGGLKLPDVEDADSPRQVFEERIGLLRDFWGVLDGLFGTFLDVRCSGKWQSESQAIRDWISQHAPRPVRAAA